MKDIAALLGSRICHDLINPLSAIGNGVELLELTGTAPGPELALVKSAIANAQARVQFFRVAFGLSGADQLMSPSEILPILRDLTEGQRLVIDWQANIPLTRQEAQLAFLAVLCVESALPLGGTITITTTPGQSTQWHVSASHDRVQADPAHWAILNGATPDEDLPPGRVHFALIADTARAVGAGLEADADPGRVSIRFWTAGQDPDRTLLG